MPAWIACLKNSVSMRKLLTRKKQTQEEHQITEWFETPEHNFPGHRYVSFIPVLMFEKMI